VRKLCKKSARHDSEETYILAFVENGITKRSGNKKRREKKMNRVTMLISAGLVFLMASSLPIIKAGAQQAVVTNDNLDQMITSAKTPADHDAIAAFYEQQAADAKDKANIHRKTADTYRRLNLPKPVGMAEMCDGIAAMWDKIAADYSKLADSHHKMAKKASAGA
jgi:hypothetical protein